MIPGLIGMAAAIQASGAPQGPTVTISPESFFDGHSGAPFYAEWPFTVVSTIGVPASYDWSIVDGTGTVHSGQGTATAYIRTHGACVIRCATVIGGGTYNPEASLIYEPGGGLGGEGGGGYIP